MGDTTRMLIQVARVLVSIGAGVLLALEWSEFRPMDKENWGILAAVALVAMVMVFVLLRKLAKTGPD